MDNKHIIKEFKSYVDGFVECCESDKYTHELLKAVDKLIEEQEERIAIMSEGGWIPVSRLPKDESDALLYGKGKGIIIAYYSDGVWYDYQHNHLRRRTHWMQIPEPPKEGEQ